MEKKLGSILNNKEMFAIVKEIYNNTDNKVK